jgi:hypothetical protein
LFNVAAGLDWDREFQGFWEKVKHMDLKHVAEHDSDWFVKDGES